MRHFLICGRTGVGKSSFINAVFGVKLANICDFEACTKTIQYYTANTFLGDICLIDTPGLAEENLDRDINYLNLIRKEVNLDEVFAVLYLTRITETRLYGDEKRTLELLNKYLGNQIWQKTWLFLTFAASLPDSKRDEIAFNRIRQIENYLKQISKQTNPLTSFEGFKEKYLADSFNDNWGVNKVPADSIFTK